VTRPKPYNTGEEMAIDIAAIQKQLDGINNPKKRGPGKRWYLQKGQKTANLRIVAFADNQGLPFKSRKIYTNIQGFRPLVCPNQFDLPDPVQDAIQALHDEMKEATGDRLKELKEMVTQLYPRDMYYALVLDREKEEEGLKIWSLKKYMVTQLYNLMLDEDYGDITDPIKGHDIKINKEDKISIIAKPKPSRLAKTDEEIARLIEEAPDLDEVERAPDFDRLKTLLEAWINNGGKYIEETETSRNVKASAREESDDGASESAQDALSKIDAAFRNL
jgi:hypothetical protein